MITAEEYLKMPVAKAITVVDLSRIDVHTHLAGSPVTVCTEGGVSYRIPEKMHGLARKAFEALAKGCAPDVEKGKLCDVMKAVAGGEEEQEAEDRLGLVASALADKVIADFETQFRNALLSRLKDRRGTVTQEVLETLLQ